MYLLDTDFAIWILRGHRQIISAVEKFRAKGSTAVSSITVAELYQNDFPSEFTSTEDFIDHQELLPAGSIFHS